MIVDHIENARAYYALGPTLAEALKYLQRTDFSKVDLGKNEIDGENLYAIVQRYDPKPLSEIVWESHRRYIDVQYVVEGSERMGCANLSQAEVVVKEENLENDCVLYDIQGDLFEVKPGTFVIYMPQDVHAPGLALGSPPADPQVLKVVAKVLVNENSERCARLC